MAPSSIKKIASIIHNLPLASSIHSSIALALRCSFIHLCGGKTVWDVFKQSLDTAIRNIEKHPRGKLFRRLIEYGPHDPDHREALNSNGETTLSDPECGTCVGFIYSHMVNRFKGEVAELLAIEPCITLIQRLQREGYLPSDIHLYWGDMVRERRRIGKASEEFKTQWGNFTKGADGLLVERIQIQRGNRQKLLRVHGITEVKSVIRSNRKVLDQINHHIVRLSGGVKLGTSEWPSEALNFVHSRNRKGRGSGLIRIMVLPSDWKLSREWHSVKTDRGRTILLPKPHEPPIKTRVKELEPNLWKVTLAWSQETLEQAAYEMTFWYMSQVGKHVYKEKSLPKGWEYMTLDEAGYNAIKMMLYYIPLRHISKRQERLAIRLYNVYCFGYPLGADSKEMLWPEDFPYEDKK
jgi:hypothetical protein